EHFFVVVDDQDMRHDKVGGESEVCRLPARKHHTPRPSSAAPCLFMRSFGDFAEERNPFVLVWTPPACPDEWRGSAPAKPERPRALDADPERRRDRLRLVEPLLDAAADAVVPK